MHRLIRSGALAGVLALSLLGGSAFASAQKAPDVRGHVYVNNNTAGTNTISGFDRHADGSLTPIAGSPFAIGGAGTGAAIGSQGALQLSADGRFLIAVDAGSNEISVARIKHDGSLQAVQRTPVPSFGTTPVSIAVHGDLVYVANAGASHSSYVGFRLDSGGHLGVIEDSAFDLPANANPGDVLFSPDGATLIGVRVGPNAGPSFIDSFSVGGDGRLTPVAGSPFPAEVTGPFGSVFSPVHPDQLFVTNAHGGPGTGSVSAFNLTDGVLDAVPNSPFANGQTGTCWAAIKADGSVLFTVNTGTNTVSSYLVGPDGRLSLQGNTPITNPGPGGLGAFDVALSPDQQSLYVVDSSGFVSAFDVDGAALTEKASSPVATAPGSHPFGLVVN
ncbi:MAG TPA: beta-propeller fold lactonase family protein [Dehalococcoidia bacterium]|nr:beta-propeller fold lactonase family protein [Dehalococcoidia bacterium]